MSPDGETLVFVQDDALWTCDTLGAGKPAKIAELTGGLLWSPKGERSGCQQRHVQKGGQFADVRDLDYGCGRLQCQKALHSRHGRSGRLVARRQVVCGSPGFAGPRLAALCHAPDGKDQRQLTKDGANYFPRFSPDSRKIAYVHQDKKGSSSIWIMDADGQNNHKIMAEEDLVSPNLVCWSPDGKRLAVGLFKYHRNEKGTPILSDPGIADFHIELLDADGQNRRRLDIAGPKVVWIGDVDWH